MLCFDGLSAAEQHHGKVRNINGVAFFNMSSQKFRQKISSALRLIFPSTTAFFAFFCQFFLHFLREFVYGSIIRVILPHHP